VLSRLAGPLSLVRCQLETGRTHQIRIHLAESGHPLVGERVYGKAIPRPIDHPRALLHAHELGFTHPAHEDRMLRFRREPPEDFLTVLAECGGVLPREDA
jgi:23S rRNA pseudouridine1911/1915/1917 synthase